MSQRRTSPTRGEWSCLFFGMFLGPAMFIAAAGVWGVAFPLLAIAFGFFWIYCRYSNDRAREHE